MQAEDRDRPRPTSRISSRKFSVVAAEEEEGNGSAEART